MADQTEDDRVPLHVVTTVIDNARETERRAERAEASAYDWRESWERVINDLGDLIHRARHRPKGRRFVTVLELNQLLTAQGRNDDGGS